MKTIYELDLHESLEIEDGIVVMRVPGGWIYEAVFVPYDDEFNPKQHRMLEYGL